MRSSAEQVAKVLGGHPSNDGWLCRCPLVTHGKRHGDQRPSLFVKDGETALLVKCFAGCNSRDVLDQLRRTVLFETGFRPRAKPPAGRQESPRFASKIPEPAPNPKALRLWLSSVPIVDTLGEIYLCKYRGLTGPFPSSIRFKRVLNERVGFEIPAIVAAVARPDRKIVAVQVTFLTEEGQKAPLAVPRLTYGKLGTGAVHLAPVADVLGLAEGLETALGAAQLSNVPTWATLGAQRLATVSVPKSVRTLHIFADNDQAGRTSAESAADRFTREGRRVILRYPPEEDGDYNDTLLRLAGSIAA